MNIKAIIAGAVSGAIAAAVVDINAWSKTPGVFDWVLAVKRWVAGAMSGALAAAGWSQVPV